MKKSVSLKLIVFSFLLVTASVAYSAPEFQGGTGTDSTKAGINNDASGEGSSAFGFKIKLVENIVLLLDSITKLVKEHIVLLLDMKIKLMDYVVLLFGHKNRSQHSR